MMLSNGEIQGLYSVTKCCYEITNLEEFRQFIGNRVRDVFPYEVAVCCLVEVQPFRLLEFVNVDVPREYLQDVMRHCEKAGGPAIRLRQETPLLICADQASEASDPTLVQLTKKYKKIASHGLLDVGKKFFSYFFFGGIHPSVGGSRCEEYLRFLVPHLHMIFARRLVESRTDAELVCDVRPNLDEVDKTRASYGLTQREEQILAWVRVGKTNWEISRIFNISENTVKNHIQNAYKKLGATNRMQAVNRIERRARSVIREPKLFFEL